MTHKDIILVCQVFYPDTQSTSQLLSELLKRMSNDGFRFTVVCGFPTGARKGEVPRVEVWNGVHINRGGWAPGASRSLVDRLVGYLSFTWFSCFKLLSARRGARVLVVTNPPYNPFVIGLVSLLRGHSCVHMLQDIYPDGLIALGKIRGGSLVDRLWRRANRWAFDRSVGLWVLGRDMKDLIVNSYAVNPKKISVIPHWSIIETQNFLNAEATALFKRLRLEGKFVVQYSGNMGLWHDLECIVKAAERLKGVENIHFLFIGAGLKKAGAEELARSLKLCNITWLPYQPLELLQDSLSCCHVALISQKQGLAGVAVPCKLYGILSAGRAIVAQVPEGSEVAMVVAEERCGVVVRPGDDVALASAILDLSQRLGEVREMGTRAYSAYQLTYSVESAASHFTHEAHTWWPSGERDCAQGGGEPCKVV